MPRSLKEFYFTLDLRALGLYRILLAGLLIFGLVSATQRFFRVRASGQ